MAQLSDDCFAFGGPMLSVEAADDLRRYHWPGNVRELQHAVERAVVHGHATGGDSRRTGDVVVNPDVRERHGPEPHVQPDGVVARDLRVLVDGGYTIW